MKNRTRRRNRGFKLLSPELLEGRRLLATVELAPVADNTLYESPTGQFSNGAGDHLFAGKTLENTNSLRRALLRFDVAGSVPAGSTIDSVTLTLNMSKTITGAEAARLHRVLDDWGEAGSHAPGMEGVGAAPQAGDATWVHSSFSGTAWDTPGGDFSATVSASTDVAGVGSYSWTGPQMVADVQGWLDSPATDFGWLLLGDEATGGSAKRYDSRENTVAANRPKLVVEYSSSNSPPTDVQLDSNLVPDGAPGATVGTLTVTDPDDDEHTLTVSDARFEVVAGKLKLKAGEQLNLQDGQSVDVTVTATDAANGQFPQDFTITVVPIENPFQNPIDNRDVNVDRLVAPLDVLLVINFLNSRPGDTSLPDPPAAPPPYVNVNGDNLIAPLDALLIINFLNASGVGEGEAFGAGSVIGDDDDSRETRDEKGTTPIGQLAPTIVAPLSVERRTKVSERDGERSDRTDSSESDAIVDSALEQLLEELPA